MTQKRTRRGIQAVEQNFLKNKFVSVDQFLDDNLVNVDSITIEVPSPLYFATRSANLDILTDQGSGRISQGLASLDVLCKGLKGIDLEKLYLFDYPVIISTPARFLNGTNIENRIVVLQTLGIFELLPLATSVQAELGVEAYALADRMVSAIKNKTYTQTMFKVSAFRTCKKVANAASIYKGNF